MESQAQQSNPLRLLLSSPTISNAVEGSGNGNSGARWDSFSLSKLKEVHPFPHPRGDYVV